MLDLDTVGCFRALQEIRLDPKNVANPPVDRLSSISPAQSASEKALKRVELVFAILKPIPLVNCIYLKILFTDVQ